MTQKVFPGDRRNNKNRRSIGTRRVTNEDNVENDIRSDGRRKNSDRRLQFHELIMTTNKSLSELEQNLDELCNDYWSAVVLSNSEPLGHVKYQLQFLSDEDVEIVFENVSEAERPQSSS